MSLRGRDLNSSLLHGRMRLGFLFALVVFCIVLTGKSFAQDSELSANEIIQILQENPDVLAEAKTEIVSQLHDRGYNVSERDITDDRLFSQIRSDDRVRQLAANELAKRGFGPAQENEQAPDEQIVPIGPATRPAKQSADGQQTAKRPEQSAAISAERATPGHSRTAGNPEQPAAAAQIARLTKRQARSNIRCATCRPCAIFIRKPPWTKPNWSALAQLFFATAPPLPINPL